MHKTTFHSHDSISGCHTQQTTVYHDGRVERQLDEATQQLNRTLAMAAQRCETPEVDSNELFHELTDQIHRVELCCRALERSLGGDTAALRRKQAEFRQQTDAFFSRSYLMNRARIWPRGYPGDYEIIETAYNNQPVSAGIGHLLDRYFLAATLAQGIQQRREKMRELLTEELQRRPAARVLNIGCGPCREVLELAPVIKQCDAHFTNVDFDTDALLFSAQRLRNAGLEDHVNFRQYNALRMVNARKNVSEFGRFDVIYTIGLLDYLSDEVLVRMLRALYATLQPDGVLIAVFKDRDQYDTEDYHWLVDWTGFLQRTAEESRRLLEKAGIPSQAVTVQRTDNRVMIFYQAVQTEDTATTLLQGPHDRRQETAPHERSTQPARNGHPLLIEQENPTRD